MDVSENGSFTADGEIFGDPAIGQTPAIILGLWCSGSVNNQGLLEGHVRNSPDPRALPIGTIRGWLYLSSSEGFGKINGTYTLVWQVAFQEQHEIQTNGR